MARMNKIRHKDVELKNEKDLVTSADKKVEWFIISRIMHRYPDHDVFGEETGRTDKSSKYLWAIDLINGATSFFHK
jgi:myo-inositol-1(or 4)-monophosphatase